MKYLRSLMQQSVTACKNQAKLIQQFTLSLLYLLIIHIVALLFLAHPINQGENSLIL